MTKLKILNRDNSLENTIEITKDDDMLNQIINSNTKIFYGCRGGSCGACACQIISGDEYIQKNARKEPAFKRLGNNEFLPCISKIKENTPQDITIEIKKKL